jgi:hypothetical protein
MKSVSSEKRKEEKNSKAFQFFLLFQSSDEKKLLEGKVLYAFACHLHVFFVFFFHQQLFFRFVSFLSDVATRGGDK